MRMIAAFVTALLVSGCAVPTATYAPKATEISEPPLGVVVTANIGDRMVTQGLIIEQDGLEVTAPFKPAWAYTIGAGSYVKTGDAPDQEFFIPRPGYGGGQIERSAIADPWRSIMTKSDGQLCIVTIFNATACDKNPSIERRKFAVITDRTLQQTLIYSGKIGNKVNIAYREFTADIARASFNNSVEYDLSESMTIGYKGAEIEIIEANNRLIKYKVIRNFNASVR